MSLEKGQKWAEKLAVQLYKKAIEMGSNLSAKRNLGWLLFKQAQRISRKDYSLQGLKDAQPMLQEAEELTRDASAEGIDRALDNLKEIKKLQEEIPALLEKSASMEGDWRRKEGPSAPVHSPRPAPSRPPSKPSYSGSAASSSGSPSAADRDPNWRGGGSSSTVPTQSPKYPVRPRTEGRSRIASTSLSSRGKSER